MNKQKLYKQIATKVQARLNCIESGNDEWKEKHEDALEHLCENLPSGSGFDAGTAINLEESKPNRLVFSADFHHMDEHGFYDGWTEHNVIVTPSLGFGLDMRVTGRNRNEIKDYITDVFYYVLRGEFELA